MTANNFPDATAAGAAKVFSPPAERAIPFPSALLERYAVERVLGEGGMAVVHLAEERKHRRKVAIKVLKPEYSASVGAERFLREIGIAARLAHPHIVPLIDSGEADGYLYYVSPYVEGGSLRDKLESENKLAVADAIRIAHEVGVALDFAHRNGFVHRDVKPENILFADDHALLADFGIARVSVGTGGKTLTEIGLALGTPEYMSPEQASGDPSVGFPGDIYGLGCVVFEMLAGEPPFRGATARATMAKQVTERARPVRSLRPDAPAGIEVVLAKALAKDPAERYASAAEFTADLTKARKRGGKPVVAATRFIAVLPFVNASPDPDNEYLSDGITDELIDALAKVEGLRVASRTSVFALKGKQQDIRAIGALLGASEILEGTVRRSGQNLRIAVQLTSADDGRLLWSQRYDRTFDDMFAIQDEIAGTIVDTLRATSFADLQPTRRRHTENVQAYGLYLRGRYAWNKRTQEGVTEGIRYFEEAITAAPDYALAYTGLADSYALHIDYRNVPVHEGFEKAKLYARKAMELDDSLAEAHASLAWSLFIYDFDYVAAEKEFKRAIQLDPQYAPAHQWYGFLLTSRGRFSEALVEAHTAQENDPASVSVRRSLGYCYLYARKYDQARYHLDRAIAMNPTAEESFRILGLVLALQGEHAEAERVLREGLALAGAGTTFTKVTLAYALACGGDRSFASQVRDELIEKRKHDYVSPAELAILHIALDDHAAAIHWCEVAVDERRGWIAYLAVHPMLDSVREEPRFVALLGRLGLSGIRPAS